MPISKERYADLFEIALSIGNSLNLDHVLQDLLGALVERLGLNAGYIYRYDEDNDNWSMLASMPGDRGLPPSVEAQLICAPDAVQNHPVTDFVELNGLFYYSSGFALNGYGLLVIESPNAVEPELRQDIDRILARVSHAALACLHSERMQQQRAEAEAANRAKSEFLARMSHEVRTPMNGILGMLELVLESDLRDDQREQLELASLSATNLLAIINDILDLSKIEAGKLDRREEETDLVELIGQTLKTHAPRAGSKGLKLLYDITPTLPRYVLLDGGRLRQVLNNLIGNAIKFTPHGEVRLEVLCREVNDGNARVEFRVVDTGIGIEQGDLNCIFEAFEQLESASNRRFEGTGLGLSIARELTDWLGGTLSVESQKDQGSTFSFELVLPLADCPETQIQKMDLEGQRVLLVDDEVINQRVFSAMLEMIGVDYDVASSGPEAIFKARLADQAKAPFSLVLCDALMPGMDGYATAKALLDEHAGRLRVLVLTSYAVSGDAQRCKDIGISGYMVKPVTLSELRKAMYDQWHKLYPESADDIEAEKITDFGSLRVLLAEDNMINQRLALSVLQKQKIQASVVENGEQVLQILQTQPFDLILMDLMMPVMDGLEATRHIRQREGQGASIPIIAMTANVMETDRQRCVEAGMDGFIGKPLKVDDLYREIERVMLAKAEAAAADSTAGETDSVGDLIERIVSSSTRSDVGTTHHAKQFEDKRGLDMSQELLYDWEGAAKLTGGDEELLLCVLEMFLQEAPGYMDSLHEASARTDYSSLAHTAHTLKGLLGTFYAESTAALALALEQGAKQQRSDVTATMSELDNQMRVLLAQLELKLKP
ncbi:MAG: response regulator [Oceanospirillales bacterium]|nr:response regulator [Oceanospirillales bacterium]